MSRIDELASAFDESKCNGSTKFDPFVKESRNNAAPVREFNEAEREFERLQCGVENRPATDARFAGMIDEKQKQDAAERSQVASDPQREHVTQALQDALAAVRNGDALIDIREDIDRISLQFDRWAKTGEGGLVERFPVVTTRELMTTKYTRTWLIHGLMVQGGFGIMVAPLKTLKTSLALLMAVSLSVGCKLFDMFVVPERRRVGFMSGEADPITIQDTLGRICASLRISAEGIDNLFFAFSVPRLDVDADLIAVEKFITGNRLEVLFLDCFYFMLGEYAEKASNLFAMGSLLRKLLEIQMRTGCTIEMLHHMPKHTQCGEPALDQAAFAGVSECARQWILLNRMEPFDPAAHEMLHKLWFVAGGSAGHCASVALDINEGRSDAPGGRHWALTATWAHEARQELAEVEQGEREAKRKTDAEIELTKDRSSIVDQLQASQTADTPTGFKDASELPERRFKKAWASLVRDKTIVLFGIIRKGNNQKQDGYCLASQVEELNKMKAADQKPDSGHKKAKRKSSRTQSDEPGRTDSSDAASSSATHSPI